MPETALVSKTNKTAFAVGAVRELPLQNPQILPIAETSAA